MAGSLVTLKALNSALDDVRAELFKLDLFQQLYPPLPVDNHGQPLEPFTQNLIYMPVSGRWGTGRTITLNLRHDYTT